MQKHDLASGGVEARPKDGKDEIEILQRIDCYLKQAEANDGNRETARGFVRVLVAKLLAAEGRWIEQLLADEIAWLMRASGIDKVKFVERSAIADPLALEKRHFFRSSLKQRLNQKNLALSKSPVMSIARAAWEKFMNEHHVARQARDKGRALSANQRELIRDVEKACAMTHHGIDFPISFPITFDIAAFSKNAIDFLYSKQLRRRIKADWKREYEPMCPELAKNISKKQPKKTSTSRFGIYDDNIRQAFRTYASRPFGYARGWEVPPL